MNKQEREQARDYACIGLIMKTSAVNKITAEAEPVVKEYWRILKDLWTKPVGFNEAENVKKRLASAEFKELNKKYRALLK